MEHSVIPRFFLTATTFALSALQVVLAPAPASALPVRKSHAEMVQDTVDKFVIPRIETFATETARLEKAVGAVCTEGADSAARNDAVAAFAGTVRAWAGLDFVRFGPAMQKNRLERVLFWPDPRGFTARQLNAALAARAPAALEPGAMEKQSVAVQGLTALEMLMFDDKQPLGESKDDAARYRCAFAHAIAADLNGVAGEMKSGWTGDGGYRDKMLNPGPANALYKDASETARDVVKALLTGLDVTSNRFAVSGLEALAQTPPKKPRLPFERARLSGEFLVASLAALGELFDTSGLSAYIPAEKPWMAKFLPNAWKSLDHDAVGLDRLRAEEPGSEEHLQALRKMKFDLSGIRQIIIKELAPNAGITVGFNELDGD
jgi:predicted lipoprotein